MDVLGHDDVGEDFKEEFLPGAFEGVFEDVAGFGGAQVGSATVTTYRDEVVVVEGLVVLEPVWHVGSLRIFFWRRTALNG